jgi:hypothetical protein
VIVVITLLKFIIIHGVIEEVEKKFLELEFIVAPYVD